MSYGGVEDEDLFRRLGGADMETGRTCNAHLSKSFNDVSSLIITILVIYVCIMFTLA